MKPTRLAALILTIVLAAGLGTGGFTALAQGEAKATLQAGKTMADNLTSFSGKTVTVHLRSGVSLTGVVKEVNAERLVLTQLSGKEFFDAMVNVEAIDALEVRAR